MERELAYVETERVGAVEVIRLASERTRNSLSNGMREALARAFSDAARDREVRAIYLTAKGPHFCSGGDLNALDEVRQDPWAVHRRFRDMGQWLLPFMRVEKPVLVGVRGYAVGGGLGLALAGDMMIASETAKFAASWLRLGIMPDALALYTLPRLVGLAKARKLFITEEVLDAGEAENLNLASEVLPDNELDARGMELAQSLASGPAEVWGLTKLILSRTFETSIDDMFLLEGLGQVVAMGGPEFDYRLHAFLEKRVQQPSAGDLLRKRKREGQ
ncbi:enoyl-CoA hydratase/isomerase family protein [Cupriavidus basilensis]|uniref:Enoyl-CoA hydratase/isomerase family protein n=1 Tax=Cupriavidus basilensis TaxID=68895 RepID=A0ABT6B4T2_9BURK|nr:enoyl-CoA hydratase/isomerase family protein [Cupriavidus basilensis]MDF3839896.1 enoyl-CoA hydratase/isomerase family protein [Cupriavidus basilensis]